MIYCVCGHVFNKHLDYYGKEHTCWECRKKEIADNTYINNYRHAFKQDNLKYLEDLYNERF